jgi:hypothetical protein
MQFYNGDDYKNWQMANLNSLIFMDSILDETLDRLRNTDAFWSTISRQELGSMLHSYWRNAGKWRLVAEYDDPQRAAQAVIAWHDVVVQRANTAIIEAQYSMVLDQQLQALAVSQTQIISRTAELQRVYNLALDWEARLAQAPGNSPLPETDRQAIWQPLSLAHLGAQWNTLLEAFPSPEAPAAAYTPWIEGVLAGLDQELQTLQAQAEALEQQRGQTAQQYALVSKDSLGLSADLQVDPITDEPPLQSTVRPTGLLMLIGTLLGLMSWATLWVISITMRTRG